VFWVLFNVAIKLGESCRSCPPSLPPFISHVKNYAVWQSASFISKGCTIVFPNSHKWTLWIVNSARLQLLRHWFSDPVCIRPQNILMFLSKWMRLQKCRPLPLLLLNRRFLSASKTQWIDQVFHPLLPFGATNWLCGAFSILSRIFFWNLESLLNLESLQGSDNYIYQTHCA